VEPEPEGSDMGERLLYRISEAADILGVSRSTLYRLIASGDLAAIRVGTAPRIPAKVLERFVDQAIRNVRIDNR
jgi:excisionase family DNA binding protein